MMLPDDLNDRQAWFGTKVILILKQPRSPEFMIANGDKSSPRHSTWSSGHSRYNFQGRKQEDEQLR
jgi:hypothetical protein